MAVINLPQKFLNVLWAEKPDPATMQDNVILVTDLGTSGCFFISNGTRWTPLGGSCVIASSTLTTSLTGFIGVQLLTSVKIPAGLMSANGQLEIMFLVSNTNAATVKRMIVRHSTTATPLTGGIYYSAALTTTNTAQAFTYIRNDNSLTAQYGNSSSIALGFGASATTGTSGTIDTNLDSYITFNAELADAGNFVTLEAYWINYLEA